MKMPILNDLLDGKKEYGTSQLLIWRAGTIKLKYGKKIFQNRPSPQRVVILSMCKCLSG